MEIITLGGGCFWCTETIFKRIKGVIDVNSGYCGGQTINPSYESICTGETGHAEVIQISYNPNDVSLETLLGVFFDTHDPTTLNRQGADVGTQYRSAIFYSTEEQKRIAEMMIEELTRSSVFPKPIVTEITELNTFYKAENYHQNYYENNKNQAYCHLVINPKLDKFLKKYKTITE